MVAPLCYYHVLLGLLLLQLGLSREERVLGEQTEDFDFDGLPGASHTFKIEVGAGKEECLFQRVAKGALFHATYMVERGGDGVIDVFLRNPRFQVQDSKASKAHGSFEFTSDEEGVYSLCIDNTPSRFSSKLVFVYMMTYVTEEWDSYMKAIEEVYGTVYNFSSSLEEVEVSLSETLKHIHYSKAQTMHDWFQLTGNNFYVQAWSIFMCSIIIVTSCFQVYFVRRMFRTVNVVSSSKPRA